MTTEQGDIVSAAQSKSGWPPIVAPTIGFVLFFALEVWLSPPRPPAIDAGTIETWLTFGFGNLLIFSVVFSVCLLLFWLSARVTTKRPSPIVHHFGGAAVLSTLLLLLGVAGQWYGRQ